MSAEWPKEAQEAIRRAEECALFWMNRAEAAEQHLRNYIGFRDPRRRGKKVHAVYDGNTKETVCEHEFSRFNKELETWTSVKGDKLITCSSCRDILHLVPISLEPNT